MGWPEAILRICEALAIAACVIAFFWAVLKD